MSARGLSRLLRQLCVALLVPVSLYAQSPPALTVRVVDVSAGPIANAHVTAFTRDARVSIAARSDSTGTARLNVAPGEYVLEIAAVGFATRTRMVAATAGGSPVQVTLAVAGVTNHVVVTASGALQTVEEVSKALTVVDAREIDARHEYTVADALRTIPGATVQQLGGPGSFTSIKMRGLREQDTAVLIDGVRFRDAGAPQGDATGFVGELYLTNLDRIEVLRGSGSSLYGSHAVAGAVNLISRAGSSTPSGNLSVEAGGLGFARVSAHAGGGVGADRLTFSVGAGHTRATSGVDGDDEARNTSVQGRGDMRLGAVRATLRAYVSDADSMINESPGAIGPLPASGFVTAQPLVTFTPALNDPDNTRASRFGSTLLRVDQRTARKLGYTVSLHHLTTTRSYRDGPLGVSAFEPSVETKSDFDGTIDTLDARGDLEWSARHVTTVAYEFERERFASRSVPVNRAASWQADIVQQSHGASVQQQVRLASLQLAAGVRVQGFSLDRPVFEPADRAPFSATSFTSPPAAITADLSAAKWLATTQTKIRAHVGNAYRAPSMYERAGSSFGSRGYTVYGDPRLEPERSVSFDAGVDQTFATGHMRTSITWFRSRLQRVIAFGSMDRTTDPFGRSSGYLGADGRIAQGIELNARVEPTSASQLSASYTFADAAAPAGTLDGLPRASAVPAHQFSLLVLHRVGRAFDMSFELEAASDHYLSLFDPVSFASRAYRFDGVVKADLAGSYTVQAGRRRLRLFATVENAFDREYFVQGFRTAQRTARGGVSLAF